MTFEYLFHQFQNVDQWERKIQRPHSSWRRRLEIKESILHSIRNFFRSIWQKVLNKFIKYGIYNSYRVSQKTFHCPIKSSPEVVCLAVNIFPHLWDAGTFFFWTRDTWYLNFSDLRHVLINWPQHMSLPWTSAARFKVNDHHHGPILDLYVYLLTCSLQFNPIQSTSIPPPF